MNRVSRASAGRIGKRLYKFRVEKRWFMMPDGVKLAATLFVPQAARRKNGSPGETFPVLLEYLPYRKDDTFYIADYPCFSYLAQLGYLAVKVDIRGTGASEGICPEREYSDIEMQDGEEVIRQLAALPQANGNVGMFGVSWSGFNSLQMAMRRPPALKAIHAVHASDDLFHDDVHYIDGNLHLDPYHLFINHELGLPPTPDYRIDEEYFSSRFDRRPWLFTYLSKQLDGEFWSRKSLKEDYSRIDIPVYLMGGLLDGYRSATMRMYENLQVPVRCDIGPWNHSCPDDGTPGPNYEWLDRMSEWFSRYLKPDLSGKEGTALDAPAKGARKTAVKPEKELLVYVRHGHKPDMEIETVPGYWRQDVFPLKGAEARTLQLDGACASSGKPLVYKPFGGTAAGTWWGDTTGDMAGDDADSLVWDSSPQDKPLQIVGFPRVKLRVKASSPKAKWTVRLEDVSPDGAVSLVTGALYNPAIREDRLKPAWPEADREYDLVTDLHFTSWTFRPGHKIRLSVSNAQLIMTWPSPDAMTSAVDFAASTMTLPVVPIDEGKVDNLPQPKSKRQVRDCEGLDFPGGKAESEVYQRRNYRTGDRTHTIKARSAYRIRGRKFFTENSNAWTANDEKPWAARYTGRASTVIVSRGRNIGLKTRILVRSDRENLYVIVSRTLTVNGKVVRQRRFRQTIARQFN